MATAARTDVAFQQCISPACGATYSVDEVHTSCPACGNLLDVAYDWNRLRPPTSFEVFEQKWMRRSDPLAFSGVWRFHELLPYAPRESVVTIGEGQTMCPVSDAVRATRIVSGSRISPIMMTSGLSRTTYFIAS